MGKNTWANRVETGIRKHTRVALNGAPTVYYSVSANCEINGERVRTKYFDTLEEARMYRKLIANAKKIRDFKTVDACYVDKNAWPHNILNAMNINIEAFPDTYDEIAENFEERFNELQVLPDRELRITIESFKEYRTLTEIGEEFGLTTNRIQQLRARAIRRLMAPVVRRKFTEIKDKMEVLNAEETKRIREEIESKLTLEVAMEVVAKAYDFENAEALDKWLKRSEVILPDSDLQSDDRIENLDLSCRSLNCLKRISVETIGDLLNLSMEDLMRVRNMGRKSAKEICERLLAHNLRLKEKNI